MFWGLRQRTTDSDLTPPLRDPADIDSKVDACADMAIGGWDVRRRRRLGIPIDPDGIDGQEATRLVATQIGLVDERDSQEQFCDGRVETPAMPPPTPGVLEQAVAVRVADIRFILDTLAALNAGANSDAEHRRLPSGVRGALRLTDVAMFGHSLGGATAAAAMLADQRIKAGVNLDGTLFGQSSMPAWTGPSCSSAPRTMAATPTRPRRNSEPTGWDGDSICS